MSAAHRLIGVAADDVIRLRDVAFKLHDGLCSPMLDSTMARIHEQLAQFTFSIIEGESEPWRGPIRHAESLRLCGRSRQVVRLSPLDVVAELIATVADACITVLMSMAGIRPNEVCGLSAGLNVSSSLPTCVELRRSPSGLFDLIYLKGLLSKRRSAPVAAEWLIGARPTGSGEISPALRALVLLQELYEPWRQRDASPSNWRPLIVSLGDGRGFRARSSGRPLLSATLSHRQKRFILNQVNLDSLGDLSRRGEDLTRYRDSAGTCVKMAQYRKTYALFVYRIDHRFIPVIARQFKHLHMAVTEGSYVGNDLTLLQDLDDAWIGRSAAFWAQFTPGEKVRVAGRAGDTIERYRHEIISAVDSRQGDDARSGIRYWIMRHNLRVFDNPDGKCLIRWRPSDARCHEAVGSSSWMNVMPNYQVRETSLCLGCSCFAIDPEHEGFWRRRYAENQTAWLVASKAGDGAAFRVMKRRSDQAAAVLARLEIALPELDEHHD